MESVKRDTYASRFLIMSTNFHLEIIFYPSLIDMLFISTHNNLAIIEGLTGELLL
jgi:hypothetical protein